jgi:porphobilinogen deaminase
VAGLNGDCHSPIAALATLQSNGLRLQVAVGRRDGQPPLLRAEGEADLDHSSHLVASILQQLETQGVRVALHGL